ncbi:hypothetical protein [Amycolatopsis rubida]|nr:hypothetical protein [Amycolatopsis rubida]
MVASVNLSGAGTLLAVTATSGIGEASVRHSQSKVDEVKKRYYE